MVEWPTEFAFPPRPGDMVESKDGKRTLKVVRVTHTTVRRESPAQLGTYTEPSFLVELHN